MIDSNTPGPKAGEDSPAREDAYVAVMTALIITILLMAVGMAVDVASWYSRSTTLQRAADAAALAGVTATPNRASQRNIATESLTKSGIVDGVNGMTVATSFLPGSSNRMQISVTDNNVTGFFTRWFRQSPSITRTATAQFIQNISMGSALNALGTGDKPGMTPDGSTQDFWLAVGGFCTAKEDGDRLLSSSDGSRQYNSDIHVCGHLTVPHPNPADAHANTDYDPAGYTYNLSVPCPGVMVDGECPYNAPVTPSPITIEIYDPSYSPVPAYGVPDPFLRLDSKMVGSVHPAFNSVSVSTTYSVYRPDATPDDHTDDGPSQMVSSTFATCQSPCADTNTWVPLITIPVGSPGGNYRVQVHTLQGEPNSFGHNVFAFRARVGATFSPCSSVPTSSAYNINCPSIAGDDSISVYANKSGAQADMYLARLAPASDYRGKRIRILLWDPGEGAKQIQILAPGSASPFTFAYKTWDPGLARLDGTKLQDKAEGWTSQIVTNTLNVGTYGAASGWYGGVYYPQWDPNSRFSDSRYNDRMVAIELTVPRNYGRDATGAEIPLLDDGWWKIRYISDTGTVTDRTTWSVGLAGDPVHLVDPNN